MAQTDLYGNSPKLGFTINYFLSQPAVIGRALLASPFYSTYEPINSLTQKGCRVSLLVRLCSHTKPDELRKAKDDPLVGVRYYTAHSFHPKFYIVDEMALVGSANLTNAGMKTNVEVSVLLKRGRDEAFDQLPGIFDRLWDYSGVLTDDILRDFERAYRHPKRPKDEFDFDEFLKTFVPVQAPPTVRVGSDKITRQRSFLQTFRRRYDEELIPAFRAVEKVFLASGNRRPEFEGNLDIEVNRFLGWLRVVHAVGESWLDAPLRSGEEQTNSIRRYVDEWHTTISERDLTAGDVFYASTELANIGRLRANFRDVTTIDHLSYDHIFDTLIGCHAFHDRLRFTEGGLDGLRREFGRRNRLDNIKRTLGYLLHGPGDQIQRAYDVIYDDAYQLEGFGELCTMELIGWVSKGRPPFNGRTIKGLRYLGFDVRG